MHLSKIEPATRIHTAWCGCPSCRLSDPIAYARARRIVRLQAATLTSFVAAIYGLALYNSAGIAAAFGLAGQ